MEINLVVHGIGNAWPVPLGETHPFYDRNDPRNLSNAAFSLVTSEKDQLLADVLIDAGHGAIQSLITGSNQIPDCICLTHGHMDHTLSVDWVVQSFWRRFDKKRLYPLYATLPVYKFLLQSFPHLEPLIEYRELDFGIPVQTEGTGSYKLTAFPVYHGLGAGGAAMLLFEIDSYKVLFTGDLFSPLLRKKDYEHIKGVDLLVIDTNNRFPWPRTNHWSFAGDSQFSMNRSEVLTEYLEGHGWNDLVVPHDPKNYGVLSQHYLKELEAEWETENQPFTIMEFLLQIDPQLVIPVHYSGAEDSRYNNNSILSRGELLTWITETSQLAGINSRFLIPGAGQVIPLQN